MTDDIHVVPGNLRHAAAQHRLTAEYLAAIPASHDAIQASLDSLGPIYRGLADAGRHLLEERRRSYCSQAAEHAELAENLDTAASMWQQHEHDGAVAFRAITDDPR